MKRLFTARGSSRRIFYLYKGKAGRARLPAYFKAIRNQILHPHLSHIYAQDKDTVNRHVKDDTYYPEAQAFLRILLYLAFVSTYYPKL